MKPELRNIMDETVKAITSAFERIDRLTQEPPVSKHQAGERFTGVIDSKHACRVKTNEHLEYAGELNSNHTTKWVVRRDGQAAYGEGWVHGLEILRVVPDEPAPKFKVGEHENLREAGCNLAEAAIRVIRDYDGTHRLSIAVAKWMAAISNEGGRGKFSHKDEPEVLMPNREGVD
jgi:hypothetical protein